MSLWVTHDAWNGSYTNFGFFRQELSEAAGLSWGFDAPKNHPLAPLLNHSDCDGYIAVKHLKALADELDNLIFGVRNSPHPWMIERTLQFADGCRRARRSGEDLWFS